MKIVFLSDDFPPKSFGGAGIIAYADARELSRRGHRVSVITTTDTKEEVGEKTLDGINIHVVYSAYNERWRHYVSLSNRKVVREVERILSLEKPDVVHAHNIHRHISYKALQVAKKYTANVFLTAHDVMSFHYGKLTVAKKGDTIRVKAIDQFRNYGLRYNPFRNYFIKRYMKNVTRIFAVSEALKKALEGNGISPVEVLHNGIDLRDWKSDEVKTTRFKTVHGLDNKKIILFGGRLSGAKGGEAIIDIFHKVIARVPDARLLIAGTVNEYTQKVMAKATDIREKIICTGWVDRKDISIVYSAADVIVVPSLYLDPFPTVNLEAMAMKRPVVGTCFGGTPEIVVNNETGYVADPHDHHLFAQKIIELLEDEKKATEFGDRGYQRIVAYFTIEKHIEALLSWYTNLHTQ